MAGTKKGLARNASGNAKVLKSKRWNIPKISKWHVVQKYDHKKSQNCPKCI